MKKLLAIAPYSYLPVYSGGQKYIAGFYEHLAEHCELKVISTKNNDPRLARGYTLLPWLKNSFSRYFDPSLARRISEEIEREHYDAVIWEHPYYAWLAKKLKKKTGIRSILHTHNIEHLRFRSLGKWWWPLLRRYERGFFRDADLLLFITDEDKKFAIDDWKIDSGKCVEVPFGINIKEYPGDRDRCREEVISRHGISPDESVLLFNGLLEYRPNLEALKSIVEHIHPRLRASGFRYRILVCGKGLPESWNKLEDQDGITYAGFVENIETYFKAADVFLNPVMSGGGVKTKIVEAIAYGTTVVSTTTGATGVDPAICGQKLRITGDEDWEGFSEAVKDVAGTRMVTPKSYYEHYAWDAIMRRLVNRL